MIDNDTCKVPGRMIYDKYSGGNGAGALNELSPTSMFGVCKVEKAGPVLINTRITTVPGYTLAPCYTGWDASLFSMEVEEVP